MICKINGIQAILFETDRIIYILRKIHGTLIHKNGCTHIIYYVLLYIYFRIFYSKEMESNGVLKQ